MAPRANWRGVLKADEISCPVALYTAASTSERIAFHTVNRETGHRVHRQFVDEETGEVVTSEDQVKGYDLGSGDFVMLAPEEVASAVPESDKTLRIETFIACNQVDEVYFDKPYYLAPGDKVGGDAFAVLRDGMLRNKVAALARTVLFRRVRTLLIRPDDEGMIANTLHFDYEIRSSKEIFADIPTFEIKGEMLELAEHIIHTKRGHFDPKSFDDRYEAALAELVKAKAEGRKIEPRPAAPAAKVVDLMEALRQSAAAMGKSAGAKPAAKGKAKAKSSKTKAAAPKEAAPRRKAS